VTVPLQPVKSSHIKAVGYDAAAGDLHVEFKDSHTPYIWHGVPAQTYSSMLAADSPGSFFHSHIRGKFRMSKPETPAAA
jgi:hypothetical protein